MGRNWVATDLKGPSRGKRRCPVPRVKRSRAGKVLNISISSADVPFHRRQPAWRGTISRNGAARASCKALLQMCLGPPPPNAILTTRSVGPFSRPRANTDASRCKHLKGFFLNSWPTLLLLENEPWHESCLQGVAIMTWVLFPRQLSPPSQLTDMPSRQSLVADADRYI